MVVFFTPGFKHPRKMLKKVFDEKILREAASILPRPQEVGPESWLKLTIHIRR